MDTLGFEAHETVRNLLGVLIESESYLSLPYANPLYHICEQKSKWKIALASLPPWRFMPSSGSQVVQIFRKPALGAKSLFIMRKIALF
jgi:hypothetical protein